MGLDFVKVERGGICVLWTHFCPLCIVICLFCKAVMWDGGISFCDRKLASSFLHFENIFSKNIKKTSRVGNWVALNTEHYFWLCSVFIGFTATVALFTKDNQKRVIRHPVIRCNPINSCMVEQIKS